MMLTTPSGERRILVSARVQPKFLLMYCARVELPAVKRTWAKKKVTRQRGMLMFLSMRSDRARSLMPRATCSLRVTLSACWALTLMVRVSGMKTKIANTMGMVHRTTAIGTHGSKRSMRRPAVRGPSRAPPEAPIVRYRKFVPLGCVSDALSSVLKI